MLNSLKNLLTHELEARKAEIERIMSESSDKMLNRAINMERARIIKELKSREQDVAMSIPDPQTIPHVFFNVELTKPASKELYDYLKLVLENYPEHLRYIYEKSQEYVDHGGCSKMAYATWKKKLKSDLGKCKW